MESHQIHDISCIDIKNRHSQIHSRLDQLYELGCITEIRCSFWHIYQKPTDLIAKFATATTFWQHFLTNTRLCPVPCQITKMCAACHRTGPLCVCKWFEQVVKNL